MQRKARLIRKRATPRRNEGRIQHERIKPKPGAPATAEEKRHLAAVAQMGCLVGHGCYGRVEVHHVHSDGLKRITRSHQRVTPLCAAHHREGPQAVHVLSHGGFAAVHRIDLLVESDRLWRMRGETVGD